MDILMRGERKFSGLSRGTETNSTWVLEQALMLQPEHQHPEWCPFQQEETLHKEGANGFCSEFCLSSVIHYQTQVLKIILYLK